MKIRTLGSVSSLSRIEMRATYTYLLTSHNWNNMNCLCNQRIELHSACLLHIILPEKNTFEYDRTADRGHDCRRLVPVSERYCYRHLQTPIRLTSDVPVG